MTERGHFTRAEIFSQPDVWSTALKTIQYQAASLRKFYEEGKFDSVLFTGCGSTYYLSITAASTFQALTGLPTRGLPASEIWFYQPEAYSAQRHHLLVAVSRSGSTTETVRAIEAFRQRRHGSVVTFSCYPDAPMAAMGELNLLFPEAQEDSIAQTRAFSTLYLATVAFVAACTGRDDLLAQMSGLPAICKRILDQYAPLAGELGRDPRFERFYCLGSGARYGLACEVSLKMKEMSLSHSEPFHFMEFRHGPMSMVDENTLLIGLLSESNYSHEAAVLNEMQALGASVFGLSESQSDVKFQSHVEEVIRNVLYLPVIQVLAFVHSLSKGLDPDKPQNLEAVIKLS
jgi:glucosamine--fructose-6-phosphate aminotransferase (isomerizing)